MGSFLNSGKLRESFPRGENQPARSRILRHSEGVPEQLEAGVAGLFVVCAHHIEAAVTVRQ